MIRKWLQNWLSVICLFAAVISVVLITVYGFLDNAFAANLTNAEKARRNTAIKILAKNLSECYDNARESIDFSLTRENRTMNYGSGAYWENPDMEIRYPDGEGTLAGKTGKQLSSNCADMIRGWKTNWFVNFFTERGVFVGVDQNIALPGEWKNEEAFYDDMGTLKKYLTNAGYEEVLKSSSALHGYKCIYFHFNINEDIFEVWKFPRPISESDKFISRETYCVPVEESGRIDFSKVLLVLNKEDQDGNGLVRDDEGREMISLNSARLGEFKDGTLSQDGGAKKFFLVTIREIHGFYNIKDSYSGEERWIDENFEHYFTVTNNIVDTETSCPWIVWTSFLIFTDYHCSLTKGVNPNGSIDITYSSFKEEFTNYVRGITVKYLENESKKMFSSVESVELDPDIATAVFTKKKDGHAEFVDYFFDQNGEDIVENGYGLSTDEQYMFYYDHLKNYFGEGIDVSNYLFDEEKEGTTEVFWLNEEENKFEKRYIIMPSSVTKTACALENGIWPGNNCGNNMKGWKHFAEEMAKFTGKDLKEAFADVKPLDEDYSEDVDKMEGKEEESKICYDKSGILGWLLCPVISGITGVGQYMWNQIEQYHMKIPTSEVFKFTGGVWMGWQYAQNVANIVFIILFLVVIFSQLTGYGIDNYGIKKILPRLIVIAILVNLSFLICQLVTDLSNVLGISLNNLFSDWAMAVDVDASEISATGATITGMFEFGIGAGAVFLFQFLANSTALGALAGIGFLVLGIVIIIVAAMLVLYLILVAREAGIILSVVIAPVAIVCFALPNTEKLGKKWLDLFKALMVVYPICGAIIGLGQLAGAILASINNEGMKVAAMIVKVLPFFFIPMLLKNSLTIMGNVGAKISSYGRSLGQRASKGAQGMIQNTERYKNWSQEQKERAEERRAGRVRERLKNLPLLNNGQRERLRKAEDILLSREKRRKENELRTKSNYFDAMKNKQDLSIEAEVKSIDKMTDETVIEAERQSLADKARLERSKARTILLMENTKGEGLDELIGDWKIAFTDNNKDDLDALTNVLIQRYGPSAASEMAKALDGFEHIGINPNFRGSMETLQQTMNDNGNFSGLMKSKAPDAFQMISDAGRRWDADKHSMVYEDLEWFSKNNQTATAAKDWATASSATLLRAINNKALSERMLRELLTSDDPAVKSGLQSEDGKRKMLEAALFMRQLDGSGETSLKRTLNAIPKDKKIMINGVEKDEWVAKASETYEKRAKQEAEAKEAGKGKITYTDIISGKTIAFDGFAHPFNEPNLTLMRVSNGHYIYTNAEGAKWDATAGRYVYKDGVEMQ